MPTPATELDADLFVIGPDAYVVAGLADDLRAQEKSWSDQAPMVRASTGSKAYMKEFLAAAPR